MDASVAITVRLPELTAARLKEIADSEYRPVSGHVRSLIEADIEERDREFDAALGRELG